MTYQKGVVFNGTPKFLWLINVYHHSPKTPLSIYFGDIGKSKTSKTPLPEANRPTPYHSKTECGTPNKKTSISDCLLLALPHYTPYIWYGGFLKREYLYINHPYINRIFHYKPSILGTSIFGNLVRCRRGTASSYSPRTVGCARITWCATVRFKPLGEISMDSSILAVTGELDVHPTLNPWFIIHVKPIVPIFHRRYSITEGIHDLLGGMHLPIFH